jgi:hypothetical protein
MVPQPTPGCGINFYTPRFDNDPFVAFYRVCRDRWVRSFGRRQAM